MNPLTAFLTGLSTGGLTCLAVQGGLLLGLLALRQKDDEALSGWQRLILPVSAFLIAKLVIHSFLGFGLGSLGEKIQLTTNARIWLLSFAALFMVVTGIRLLKPRWLPWFQISPPAMLRRLVRKSAKSEALLAPAMLGLLTIFIPCGTTQAMEVAAITTGSAWQGASIMFAFVLGTAPLFFLVGFLAKGSTLLQRRLKYVTAAVVITLGFYTFNGVLNLTDSPYSFQNQKAAWSAALSGGRAGESTRTTETADSGPVIEVSTSGYAPNSVTVPTGKEVQLSLVAKGQLGCTSIFRIPKLGIQQQVASRSTTTVAVTFPQPGKYTFTCGMGMFSGTINAV